MFNPFNRLLKSDRSSVEKKREHKKLSDKAWELSMKVVKGKLLKSDVDEMDKLYKSYFKKYPDTIGQRSADERIRKMRQFAK
jgi:hypothetical protein